MAHRVDIAATVGEPDVEAGLGQGEGEPVAQLLAPIVIALHEIVEVDVVVEIDSPVAGVHSFWHVLLRVDYKIVCRAEEAMLQQNRLETVTGLFVSRIQHSINAQNVVVFRGHFVGFDIETSRFNQFDLHCKRGGSY